MLEPLPERLKSYRQRADEQYVDELTREFLAESHRGLDRMEQCLTELERRPGDAELIAEIFRAVHTIKGATGFLGFGRLEAVTHVGETLLASLRAGKVQTSPALIDGLLALLDCVRKILGLIESTGGEGQRSTDDDFELLAHLISLNTPPVAEPSEIPRAERSPQGLGEPKDPTDAIDGVERRLLTQPVDQTVRVDVEILDRMLHLVGELVLTKNQFAQRRASAAEDALDELEGKLDLVASKLQDAVTQARMQPVDQLFKKFPRLVRDLAQVCGRRVRVEFEGEDTRLDKTLLDAVRDPLTHAVRNAIDHGIESAEERAQLGKPLEGLIRLTASQSNGAVLLEVLDDGAGISVERVVASALERGIITHERAAAMSDTEALQLIFAPGLSTAESVTNVSGRGVGMDVVRANVEQVGGTVEVESQPGFGTKVRIQVPLTLAIVPALILRSGGALFALSQSAVEEIAYVPVRKLRKRIDRIGATETYQLRGKMLSLVRLNTVLELQPNDGEQPGFYVAAVRGDGVRFALAFDYLLSPEEIVVKPLSLALREVGAFSGATVLGNGALAMILDVTGIGARGGVHRSHSASVIWSSDPSMQTPSSEPTHSVVIYEVAAQNGSAQRMAVPLAAVERILYVARADISFHQDRPVIQHSGEVIEIVDEAGTLFEHSVSHFILLICNAAPGSLTRRIGLVAERIVDISSTQQSPTQKLVLLDQHITCMRSDLTAHGEVA